MSTILLKMEITIWKSKKHKICRCESL